MKLNFKFIYSFFLLSGLLYLIGCEKEDKLNPDERKSNCRNGISLVRKVLVIGIDGCRSDALIAANSPGFDSLITHAYVNFHCDRGPFTVSCPGWSTLLHGVFPEKHNVTSNDLSNLNYGKFHDLFYYMRQVNSYYSLATVSHWDNFLRMTTNEDYAQTVNCDDDVKDQAIYLLNFCVPDVLLLHFDDIDHTGHDSGFSPDNSAYINSIQETGNYVSEIMSTIQMREQIYGEEWMVIVVTDHGGSGTSHGGQDNLEETRFVFEIVRLPFMSQMDLPVASNVDIMPTILKYMNISIESSWDLDGSPLF